MTVERRHDDPVEALQPSGGSDELRRALEALIMVSDQPAEPAMLAELLGVSAARVDELARQVAAEFAERRSGFVLARVAGARKEEW